MMIPDHQIAAVCDSPQRLISNIDCKYHGPKYPRIQCGLSSRDQETVVSGFIFGEDGLTVSRKPDVSHMDAKGRLVCQVECENYLTLLDENMSRSDVIQTKNIFQ